MEFKLVVNELFEGKRLHLPDGSQIGMGADFSIGFVFKNARTGEETIGGLSTMDLAQLAKIIEKNNISPVDLK